MTRHSVIIRIFDFHWLNVGIRLTVAFDELARYRVLVAAMEV